MLPQRIRNRLFPVSHLIDALFVPLTYPALIFLKELRAYHPRRMPFSRAAYRRVGLYPILDHYYEPLFQPRDLRRPLTQPRDLPGIDFRDAEQLELLASFSYQEELSAIPDQPIPKRAFGYANGAYIWGDAELLYAMIRKFRPKRLIEIGSGHSTLMSLRATRKNAEENPAHSCRITCIEPYESPWLDSLGIEVVRQKVEDVPANLFAELGANDILFIDSSHMIRPQGDVLTEFLQILPRLKPGVLIHVHDIFTPRDYPEEWVLDAMRLWNEQYLLEAFLTFNVKFHVVAALNYLKHAYPKEVAAAFPCLGARMDQVEPGAFWMVRA